MCIKIIIILLCCNTLQTVTTDMADGTREAIREMTQLYMSNPNSIILCIQGQFEFILPNKADIIIKTVNNR